MCTELNPHDLDNYGNAMLPEMEPVPRVVKDETPKPCRKHKYLVHVAWIGTAALAQIPIIAESSDEAADLATDQLTSCLSIEHVELITEEL